METFYIRDHMIYKFNTTKNFKPTFFSKGAKS